MEAEIIVTSPPQGLMWLAVDGKGRPMPLPQTAFGTEDEPMRGIRAICEKLYGVIPSVRLAPAQRIDTLSFHTLVYDFESRTLGPAAQPDDMAIAVARAARELADEDRWVLDETKRQLLEMDLDAAPDEALAQDNDHLFSDTDDISEAQRIAAERDEARESLRVALEENAALKAREPEVRIERVEVERIVERVVEVSSPEAAPLKIIPDEIAAMMDPGDTFSPEVRRKLTERLNVELAELKNLRGLAGEDLKREAEIEKLLGLFARLGEI